MNTELDYMYRDGSNYKFHSSIILEGNLSIEDLDPYLHESEYFLPSLVGLQVLVPEYRDADDHEWHELTGATPTDEMSASMSAAELINKFKKASKRGWPLADVIDFSKPYH